jgi:hypothetical protein
MPDFVRIVDRMPMTGTEKVLVRQLKREGYDLSRDSSLVVYFRRRGEAGYRRMSKEDYAALVAELTRNGRGNLLL